MPKIPKDSTNPSNINKANHSKNLTKKEIEKLAEEYEKKFFKGRQDISYGWDKVKDPNSKKTNWVIFIYGETNDSLKKLPDEYKGVKIIKEVIGKMSKE
ncbi:MAG: hypothetical protein HY094_00230 [Candidatus Melainabacteria bacterium]|nr:hypothetical protein [Candidatus Melainabacteria bacterium]